MTYEEELKKTSELLDTIDIEKFYDNQLYNYSVSDLMSDLETYCENDEHLNNIISNDFFQGFLFNAMTESEFIDYLKDRYKNKVKFQEVTITYIWK